MTEPRDKLKSVLGPADEIHAVSVAPTVALCRTIDGSLLLWPLVCIRPRVVLSQVTWSGKLIALLMGYVLRGLECFQ
jgi:hypothetical protein